MAGSNLTRRAFVGAAGAALTGTAAAAFAGPSEPNPDAEILSMQEEFDSLLQQIAFHRPAYRAARERFEAAVIEARPRIDASRAAGRGDDGFVEIYLSVMTECGAEPALTLDERLHERFDELRDLLLNAGVARTPEGQALQARLLTYEFLDDWEEPDPDEWGWTARCARLVVDAACARVGLDYFGRPLATERA